MSQYSIQEGNITWCLQFFITNCDNKWNGSVRKKSILNTSFCGQSVSWILPQDICKVKPHYGGTFWARKCAHFKIHFVLFHLAFWKTIKMDLWHKFSHTILVIFQMIVFFQKTYMYSRTYACLNGKLHPDVFLKSHEWNSSCKIEMGQWTHM
jgi:hypothetical protein